MNKPFYASVVAILMILIMFSSATLHAESLSDTSSRAEIDPSLSVEVDLLGPEAASGYYPTGTYNISVDVGNDGNIDFSVVTVTCEVFKEKDFSSQVEGFPSEINLTSLNAGSSLMTKFPWTVSTQGNYTINITAVTGSTTEKISVTFRIMNIVDIGVETWSATAPFMEALNYYPTHTNIELKVDVKNFGNMELDSVDVIVKITYLTTTEYEDTADKDFILGLDPGETDVVTIDTQWSSSVARSYKINITLDLENDLKMNNNYLEDNLKTGNKTNIVITGISDGVMILQDGGMYEEKSTSLRVLLDNKGNVKYNQSFWVNLSIWQNDALTNYNTVGWNQHYFSTDDLDTANSIGYPGQSDIIFFSSWTPAQGSYVIKVVINSTDDYTTDNTFEINVEIKDYIDLNVTITEPLHNSSLSTKGNLYVNVTVNNLGNQMVSTAMVQVEIIDLDANTTVVGPNPLTFTNINPQLSKYKTILISSWNPVAGNFRITATIDLATDENASNDVDSVEMSFFTPLKVGSIEGVVTNFFGVPIPDALVSLEMTRAFELSAFTDETGSYSLDDVPVITESRYNITAVKTGQYFRSYNDSVVVQANLVTEVNFVLESEPLPLIFPLDGSQDVEIFETVDVIFEMEMEELSITSSTFYLEDDQGAVDGTLNFSTESAGIFNKTAVNFIPDENLTFNTTYTLTISSDVRGIGGDYPLWLDYTGTFTTVDRFLETPQVSPVDSALDVELNVIVTAIFTSKIDPGTIDISTFTLRKTGEVSLVPAQVNYDDITRVATLVPNEHLETGTEYTATLTTGIRDDLGASMLNDYTWKFKTVSLIYPDISGIVPVGGAVNVLISTTVKVTFSKAMDQVPTEGAFSLVPDVGEVVTGTYSWSDDSQDLTFQPEEDLEYNMTYTVVVGIAANDTDALNLENEFTSSFTTQLDPAGSTPVDIEDDDEGIDPGIILLIIVIIIIIILIIVMLMVRRPAEEEYAEEEPTRHYDEYEGEEFGDYECPECGTLVSGEMPSCPGCGAQFEEALYSCPDCGTQVEEDTVQCPECDYAFGSPEGEEGEEIGEDEVVEEYEDYEVIDEEGEEGVIIPGESEYEKEDVSAEPIDEDDLSIDDMQLD